MKKKTETNAEINVKNISLEVNSFKKSDLSLKNLFRNLLKKNKRKILSNISFKCNEGDKVAIVGKNGSGKSTLLRVISNIYLPTKGHFSIKGDYFSIIEMALGFDEEFSVINNIYFSLVLKGCKLNELSNKAKAILDFSELQDFKDEQLKNLSSGMKARLSFAIGSEFDAEILILDEVFAAGDRFFLDKAKKKISKKMKDAKILLLVSHREDLIKSFCNRVIILENGKLIFNGSVKEGLDKYHKNETKKN